MRYAPRAILAGGLGFAAALVVACGGSSGLLSGGQSIELSGQADEIASAVQSGDCVAAINASADLSRKVQTLPANLNPTLRGDLTQGASTIAQLAGKDCRQQHTSAAPAPPHTSSSTSTTTTTSTSTSTHTSPPTTTATTSSTSTTATTPTNTGTTSTTTGGAGLGGGSTTTTGGGNGNGTGGAGAGNGNSNGTGG